MKKIEDAVYHKNKYGQKVVHDEFVLDKNVPYERYLFRCEELDGKVFDLPVGQRYIVGTVTDDNGDREMDDLVEAEECHNCGEIFDTDHISEYDYGEYYCEDCGKDLMPCECCGKQFYPTDEFEIDLCPRCQNAFLKNKFTTEELITIKTVFTEYGVVFGTEVTKEIIEKIQRILVDDHKP